MVVSRTATQTSLAEGPARLLSFVLLAALVAAGAGVALVVLMLATRPSDVTFVAEGEEAESGGVSLRIESSEWLDDEEAHRDQGEVFPMPASMMPDMPADGLQRLHVELSLQNRADGAHDLTPADFRVSSVSGESWAAMASTLPPSSLGPGQALNGAVFFDVPEGMPGVYFVWSSGGTEAYMPIGDVPVHDH